METRIYTDKQAQQPLIVWLDALKDLRAKAQIQARMARVAAGIFGDCKPLREGVQELRIDVGAGYRVYLSRQGPVLVLLCGDRIFSILFFILEKNRKTIKGLNATNDFN